MRGEPNPFIGSIPWPVLRIWLARLGMVIFCGVCLLLVWWSLFVRLQPVNRAQRESALAMSLLSDEVDQLQLKLNAESLKRTEARFNSARQLLFTDTNEVLDWQDDITHQASDLGLDLKIDLSPPQPLPGMEQKASLVNANIDISPVASDAVSSPYQRMLQFVEILANSGKRCDLMTLSVEGNFNSVQHAKAIVQILTEPKGTH